MNAEIQEEARAVPWTHPDVVELHNLFYEEFAQTQSPEEGAALFRRFFAPAGLVDKKLEEWQGKNVEFHEVMAVAFELYTFSCFVFISFFLNDYPEEIVEAWWKNPGMRLWVHEQAFMKPLVQKIKEKFDGEAAGCQTMLDVEGLREKYLSLRGVIAQEFENLRALDQKEQVAVGTELLSLKSYITYGLFAIEYSAKVATWTVPEVRKLLYRFERELKSLQSDDDIRALQQRYIGEEGVYSTELRTAEHKTGKAREQHIEELCRFREAVQSFFSHHTTEDKNLTL